MQSAHYVAGLVFLRSLVRIHMLTRRLCTGMQSAHYVAGVMFSRSLARIHQLTQDKMCCWLTAQLCWIYESTFLAINLFYVVNKVPSSKHINIIIHIIHYNQIVHTLVLWNLLQIVYCLLSTIPMLRMAV